MRYDTLAFLDVRSKLKKLPLLANRATESQMVSPKSEARRVLKKRVSIASKTCPKAVDLYLRPKAGLIFMLSEQRPTDRA